MGWYVQVLRTLPSLECSLGTRELPAVPLFPSSLAVGPPAPATGAFSRSWPLWSPCVQLPVPAGLLPFPPNFYFSFSLSLNPPFWGMLPASSV